MKLTAITTILALLLQNALFSQGQSSGQIKTGGINTCLDIAGGSLANGALAQNNQCSVVTSPTQIWQFQASNVAGNIVLRTANGFCLDVPNGNAYNGAQLQLWTCNLGNKNQFFTRDGTSNIEWNQSGYCLDVYHGASKAFSNGLSIVLWTCSLTNTNQIFAGPAVASISTSISPVSSTSKSSTTSSSPTATSISKPALTSIFKPAGKRMLAWGFDSTVAGTIGSGKMISSYHHWEDNVVTQMPAKDTFIPTYWGITKNASWAAVKKTMAGKIPPVVMSFNEPDISTQANMDPSLAAWVFYNEITIPFGNKGSNVVAPAIVWNLNGWLKPFMNRCSQLGCNIDAMGQHVYVSLNGDVDAAVASVKTQVTNVYNAFGKPIVLSEVGLTQSGGGTQAQINEFVEKVGAYLDGTNYVLAWALSAVFAINNGWDGYLNSNMAFYNSDKSLRPLGSKYMNDAFTA